MRTGRITASKCGSILRAIARNSFPPSFFQMLYGTKSFSSPAICHGLQFERTAIELYETRKHVRVQAAGFLLSKNGVFGCSADGFLNMEDSNFTSKTVSNSGLVEVKFPYKYRSSFIREALKEKNFCLDSKGTLKKSHIYWDQVQMSLYLSNRAYCDFIVYTFCDLGCIEFISTPSGVKISKNF